MRRLATAVAGICVCVAMVQVEPAAAAKALVRSSLKLTSNVDAPASKGRVVLSYDTNDEAFAAALAAASPASIVVADSGGFRVTLNADTCFDSPKKIVCSGDSGMTSIKLIRRPPNAPAPYRVIAKRKNVSSTDTGIAPLQAPATIQLKLGSNTSRFLRSPSCTSPKSSRLSCKTVFNRNHVNSPPSFVPGYSVWLPTPLLAAEKGLYSRINKPASDGYTGDFSTPDPRSLPGWAVNFSEGSSPTDSGQSLGVELEVLSTTWNLAFDAPPSLDPLDGTLAFTTTPGTYGKAHVQATLRDDGGTAGGGEDTFVTSFDIAVNSPAFALDLLFSGPAESPCIPLVLRSLDPDGTWDVAYRRINSTTNGVLFDFIDEPFAGDGEGSVLCYRPRRFFSGLDQFSYEAFDLDGYAGLGGTPAYGNIVVRP